MTNSLIRTIAAAAAVLAAGLALAACSSDNATGPSDAQVKDAAGTSTTQPTTTKATTTTAEPRTTTQETTTQAASAEGEQIFATSCAGCHTFAAADASGQVGPNLDQTKPSKALALDRVTNGRAGMPAFEGQLSPEEITAVATYVADNAGG